MEFTGVQRPVQLTVKTVLPHSSPQCSPVLKEVTMVIKDFFSASIPTHRCILSAVLVAAIGAMSVTLVPQWIKKIKKQAVRHDIPEDAPEHCPGVESEQAGKASACAGCPNQNICASGKAVVADPTIGEVHDKMASIRKRVLVLSGKGGVGKSTVSAQLGWLLQSRGFQVGLLDIDVCGPSIPTMTGSRTKDVHASADGWSPIYVRENFAVMSIGYLLPHEDDAVIWRGPKKNGIIRQFLTDVNWGELDVLLIDTPPGTSDEHLSIVTYLTPMSIDGAIIVTTSQHVALRDVRKEINFCKKVGVKIIGVVENMTSSVFDAVCPGAVETMCSEMEVPFVGSVPLDRDLLFACEVGRSIAEVNAQSASAQSLSVVLDKALTTLEMPLLGDFPQEPHNADSTGSEQSVEEQEDKNNVRPALATSSEGFKGEAVTLGYADPQRQPQVKASSLEVTLRREPSPASGGPAVSAAQSRINEDVCKTSPLFPMSA